MTPLRRPLLALLLLLPLAAAPLGAGGPRAEGAAAPVVVELFTSQGCNACPPADALLGELAGRPDVIALAYHVDYWDYIGWRDPFGSAANTQRQRGYAAWLGSHMVYTPQMVIAGRFDAVGSKRPEVEAGIARARAEPGPLAVSLTGYSSVAIDGPAGIGPATVLAVIYQAAAATPVADGENAGQTLSEFNIVREMIPVGRYLGGRAELPLDGAWLAEAGYDGCAILVQDDATGRILGAARMTK